MIPGAWISAVLALGVFRIWRFLGEDDFPPIAKLRAKLVGETARYDTTKDRDHPILTYKRPTLNHFLGCPYCLGAWLSLATYLAWRWFPTETLYALAPFALSAAVGLIVRNLD